MAPKNKPGDKFTWKKNKGTNAWTRDYSTPYKEAKPTTSTKSKPKAAAKPKKSAAPASSMKPKARAAAPTKTSKATPSSTRRKSSGGKGKGMGLGEKIANKLNGNTRADRKAKASKRQAAIKKVFTKGTSGSSGRRKR